MEMTINIDRKKLLDAVLALMPKDASLNYLDGVKLDACQKLVEKINNEITSFQKTLASKGEACEEQVRQYVSNGAFYRSEAHLTETQKLIDSWKGFPKSEAERIMQKALSEIDQKHESAVNAHLAQFGSMGVKPMSDIDFGGDVWRISVEKKNEILASAVCSLSDTQAQDLCLLIARAQIDCELVARGYRTLLEAPISQTIADTPQLRAAISSMHSAYKDYRTTDDQRKDIVEHAKSMGIAEWQLV